MSKITDTDTFKKYYDTLKMSKPAYPEFVKLHIYFKIGVYYSFFEQNNIFLATHELGYKIFKRNCDKADREIVTHLTGKCESPLLNIVLGINQTLIIIQEQYDRTINPF